MTISNYREYKAREFCNDVNCPVQIALNSLKNKPEVYELIRQTCRAACRFTTWQFHHWLIEKGYITIISAETKNDEKTILLNLDRNLSDWIDQKVKQGKHIDGNELIVNAIARYKKALESRGNQD